MQGLYFTTKFDQKEDAPILKNKLQISNRKTMLIIFSVIILLFSSIALISSSMAIMASDRIFYGVSAQEVPLGGLTKAHAQEKLTTFYQAKLAERPLFILTYQEQTWEIQATDIDFALDTATTAQKAYDIGRESNLLKKIWMRIESAHHGMKIPNDIHYSKDKLTAILTQISKSVATTPQNARCTLINGEIKIEPESIGRSLEISTFFNILQQNIIALSLPTTIVLPINETFPTITAESLKSIDSVLATYTSHFNHFNYNRSENIKIAANSINHILIQPNQTISFNDIVGLRVAEAGFKEAPVIIDGKTVPDIGGGVCQVSSTLYNSILLADLQPIERTPHFHPLGYVPIGLDATVADNLLDFKFKNNLNNNIYIISQIIDGDLTVLVLGSSENISKEKISLTAVIDKTLPPTRKIEYDSDLPKGKKIIKEDGITGYIVSSYRIKSINDKEISRELLYVDEYTPEDEIVVIGTYVAPPSPTNKAATLNTLPAPAT